MRKRSEQIHGRESSATLQLTVSLLYPIPGVRFAIVGNIKYNRKKLTVADNDSLRK
mgnify:CR=1 FL=1